MGQQVGGAWGSRRVEPGAEALWAILSPSPTLVPSHGVCIPLGVESGPRSQGWEQDSSALNRAGHPKALEMLFIRSITFFFIFSSCQV